MVTSRQSRQPYYPLSHIERICTHALQSVDLLPTSPSAIRVDRFVEKYFGITIEYEDLPASVLGYTRFSENGVDGVVISSTLDQDGSRRAERRVRSTLAHEAGHGLLHAQLFSATDRPDDLFEEHKSKPTILCRDIEGEKRAGSKYDGRWWEVQANRAIGSLLMPRSLVISACEPFTTPSDGLGLMTLSDSNREAAEKGLATVFDVNPVVARIRLRDVFGSENNTQAIL